MNKKGFTLIELLAIIVILAIIAVITVPIILNIIENSKKGAAQDSAYGFKDAVEKYYVAQLYDSKDLKLVGTYNVLNGVLKGNSFPAEGVLIPADGTIPTSGYLDYKDNKFSGGCLVIGDYAVTFEDDTISTVKGKCGPELTGIDYTFNQNDGYKYIDSTYVQNNPIYYNPVTSKICNRDEDSDKYVSSNSNTGFIDGCMKWYAYSVKGNVVNMILDHNINPSNDSGVEWCNETDYNKSVDFATGLGVTNIAVDGVWEQYTGSHDKGPLTALNYFKNSLSNWSTFVQGDYKKFTSKISNTHYSIDYSGYKARLITAQEIAYINGHDFDEQSDTVISVGTLPNWLFENFPANSGYYGYWTSSAIYDSNGYKPAYMVLDVGILYGSGGWVNYGNNPYPRYGVRPVITVPATEIFPN